jgi:hypothetical protein
MLLLALSLGWSSPARASATTEGGGIFTTTDGTYTLLGQGGGNAFYGGTFSATFTGILTGSCSGAETGVIHADGSGNWKGSASCTGTVAGQSGAYSFDFTVKGAPDGSFKGSFVLSGTGALANLHGESTMLGTPTDTGDIVSYTAHLQLNS